MEDKFFTLREVELNNNCPECYSRDGLQLTFKQRFVENSFYRAISSETAHALFCNVCETSIFPARWTDDIEKVFEYQQRASTPKPTSFKLKTASWISILLLAVLLIVVTLFFLGIFKNLKL
ncbi:hypothetical protein LX77_03492 [Gelidibacter algens]|jgi:hypothetical protein|uniref:Uncharacterized protein n=1 Tax=Gelidibacter algens TaxID=49280 RepID=A0A1A7QVP6_9FLAO|nr:hypothetical protein [Gelidibacter algens]OBX23611.1 hypothetical protein A9996_15710 [Gelidibacter algens]RAJ19250.1 hypothetical protein LX77_03492 [Gelidibacter algens]